MRIIYETEGGGVGVLRLNLSIIELGIATTEDIANKDVPHGVPYWIVSKDDIPADRSKRGAWELDGESLGEPDGTGGQSNTFSDEQIKKLNYYMTRGSV